MDVGIQVIFSSFGSNASDSQVYSEEVRLCLLAEDLGYDVIWPVEHHFTDYSFCPDNTQFLSYLAGRTSTIDLGLCVLHIRADVQALFNVNGNVEQQHASFALNHRRAIDKFDVSDLSQRNQLVAGRGHQDSSQLFGIIP